MSGNRLRLTGAALALLAVVAGAVLLVRGDIAGVLAPTPSPPPGILGDGPAIAVTVDTRAAGAPISPYVYGVAFADPATLEKLGATLDRWGGNASTRFNWTVDADNAARDWEFRNKPSPDPAGFVAGAHETGAGALMTVPTIGWVARDSSNATQSTGVPPAGGRAINPAGAIAGYDPARNRQVTSVPSLPRRPASGAPAGAVFQDDFVRSLVGRSGAAAVPFFAMDNEPDAWALTHTDVHPAEMGYDDMLRNFVEYSSAVKEADPAAAVVAPELCCWTSLEYSALDRGGDNFRTHADRAAHGGAPFLEWWLRQVAAADRTAGKRRLDLVSVHFYPQADGVYSDKSDARTQALRIRSTRGLWDPSYVDESWIGQPVQLLPRLQHLVAATYPGTRIAVTEYSFGGEHDASGAVAQAEALGILGREGAALAATWTYPSPDSPAGAAFRLFRNYDGAGGTFGDRSFPVHAGGTVAAFAARHSDSGEVDVVVANESLDRPASIHVNIPGAQARLDARFVIQPGSGVISALAPADATELPPLGLALLRFRR